MNQITLTDIEYSNRKKKTKREEFLDAMEELIHWSHREGAISYFAKFLRQSMIFNPDFSIWMPCF